MSSLLHETSSALLDNMKAIRRDLHAHPEQGWLEMRTGSLIAARLSAMGYEVLTGADVCRPDARMGVPSGETLSSHYHWALENGADPLFASAMQDGLTGVIGILRCGEGPVVAMRFDMDALPIVEAADVQHFPARSGFSSTVPGSMHACGHDGHVTIGLFTAELLMKCRHRLHGTVKLIFQPAEEGVRGAKSIVEAGHLDDVDFCLSSHISASEDGSCYLCPGMAGTFATTKLDAVFHGSSAHAGICPEKGSNAMLAIATAILNLQSLPRNSTGSSRVNVGRVEAGSGRNIICDSGTMLIEVRGETTQINDYMESYARRILEHAAAMHGCSVSISVSGSAPSMECSSALTERIFSICHDKLSLDVRPAKGMGGSEDFAYMASHVISRGGQACFTGIHVPVTAPLHNERFDFDEAALSLGAAYYAGTVLCLLND